jgi:transposase
MAQGTILDFSGTTLFCGVDVHKRNWSVNIHDGEFELKQFSQDADPVLLHKYLARNYPGAKYKVCYEAGFSGFSAQRYFADHGIDCLVFNAADVATSDKEKRRKNDTVDARKLREHLQSSKARGIYIPSQSWEHARTLVRARSRIVGDQTRCKNRIWQLLHFSGLKLPPQFAERQYWSRRFLATLETLDCGGSQQLKASLDLYLAHYKQTRSLLLSATRVVRQLCGQPEYADQIQLLRTIPGIGQVNAAVILFELQNINRFEHFDQLSSYAGLIPDTGDSGDTRITKDITSRANNFLRVALVESSWAVIRQDPALLMKYKEYGKRMNRNKAIIRIAKHLLSRIRFVLKNQQEYVTGVVQ